MRGIYRGRLTACPKERVIAPRGQTQTTTRDLRGSAQNMNAFPPIAVQRSAKRLVRGWEKFVLALAYLICLALPGSCLARFAHFLAGLCTCSVQGDTSGCGKPPIDIKTTVLSSQNGTFVMMLKGGSPQPDVSPCSRGCDSYRC